MDADIFSMSIRTFLKRVGMTSQQEIERAVAKAIKDGHLQGDEVLPVKMKLTLDGADLDISFDGVLELD